MFHLFAPIGLISTAMPLPPWALMWMLSVAIYGACKWLTWHFAGDLKGRGRRVAAYLLAWPGMDIQAFVGNRTTADSPTTGEWLFAAMKTAGGLILLYGVVPEVSPERQLLVGWLGMTGLIFVLHFGLFHLLSCWWRLRGVDAKPLMDWPIVSTSLGEFWGRRWNRAFRDLTFRYLFRPLTRRIGATAGLLAGFLMSGLVHDAVISLPAGGGYGGPTLFFVIQAVGMLAERSRLGRRAGLGRGAVGWLFSAACLVLPAGILFHPPFVRRVIVPFLEVLGAV